MCRDEMRKTKSIANWKSGMTRDSCLVNLFVEGILQLIKDENKNNL